MGSKFLSQICYLPLGRGSENASPVPQMSPLPLLFLAIFSLWTYMPSENRNWAYPGWTMDLHSIFP